jgi:hypothetical protein
MKSSTQPPCRQHRSRRHRSRLTVLPAAALAAVLLASCTGGSGGPASPLSPGAHASGPGGGAGLATGGSGTGAGAAGGVRWHKCPASTASGGPGGGKLRCATLHVPLNYQQPSGRKITLALSEVPATAPAGQRQGVLLVNPGGPGASGLGLAASVAGALTRRWRPTMTSSVSIRAASARRYRR